MKFRLTYQIEILGDITNHQEDFETELDAKRKIELYQCYDIGDLYFANFKIEPIN